MTAIFYFNRKEMRKLQKSPCFLSNFKYCSNWPSGFREENFLKLAFVIGCLVLVQSGRNEETLWMTFHRYFLSSLFLFSLLVSSDLTAMLLVISEWQGKTKGPFVYASCKGGFQLAYSIVFQRRRWKWKSLWTMDAQSSHVLWSLAKLAKNVYEY